MGLFKEDVMQLVVLLMTENAGLDCEGISSVEMVEMILRTWYILGVCDYC